MQTSVTFIRINVYHPKSQNIDVLRKANRCNEKSNIKMLMSHELGLTLNLIHTWQLSRQMIGFQLTSKISIEPPSVAFAPT